MSPTQFRDLAIRVVGDKGWQTRIAEQLQVDGSTVRRWVSGAVPIPNTVAVAMTCLADSVAR